MKTQLKTIKELISDYYLTHEYTTSFKIAAIITMSFILTGIIAAVVNL